MLFLPSSMSELSLRIPHFAYPDPPFLSRRYFTSRPDLLSRVGGGAAGTQILAPEPTSAGVGAGSAAANAITGAAQRAVMADPVAASRLLAAGINRASSSPGGNHTSNRAPAINVGHVAAAAQAFSSAAPPPPKSTSPPAAAGRLVPQKVSPFFSFAFVVVPCFFPPSCSLYAEWGVGV
jgi:hypothetical protein